jgi:hypothetical protein
MDDAHKAMRTNEMRSLKAVFIAEGINELIQAWFKYANYQPRFTGTSKVGAKGNTGGVGTIQFVPPTSQGDKVGKEAAELADAVKAGRATTALQRLYGEQKVREFQAGEITIEQLLEEKSESSE